MPRAREHDRSARQRGGRHRRRVLQNQLAPVHVQGQYTAAWLWWQSQAYVAVPKQPAIRQEGLVRAHVQPAPASLESKVATFALDPTLGLRPHEHPLPRPVPQRDFQRQHRVRASGAITGQQPHAAHKRLTPERLDHGHKRATTAARITPPDNQVRIPGAHPFDPVPFAARHEQGRAVVSKHVQLQTDACALLPPGGRETA